MWLLLPDRTFSSNSLSLRPSSSHRRRSPFLCTTSFVIVIPSYPPLPICPPYPPLSSLSPPLLISSFVEALQLLLATTISTSAYHHPLLSSSPYFPSLPSFVVSISSPSPFFLRRNTAAAARDHHLNSILPSAPPLPLRPFQPPSSPLAPPLLLSPFAKKRQLLLATTVSNPILHFCHQRLLFSYSPLPSPPPFDASSPSLIPLSLRWNTAAALTTIVSNLGLFAAISPSSPPLTFALPIPLCLLQPFPPPFSSSQFSSSSLLFIFDPTMYLIPLSSSKPSSTLPLASRSPSIASRTLSRAGNNVSLRRTLRVFTIRLISMQFIWIWKPW